MFSRINSTRYQVRYVVSKHEHPLYVFILLNMIYVLIVNGFSKNSTEQSPTVLLHSQLPLFMVFIKFHNYVMGTGNSNTPKLQHLIDSTDIIPRNYIHRFVVDVFVGVTWGSFKHFYGYFYVICNLHMFMVVNAVTVYRFRLALFCRDKPPVAADFITFNTSIFVQ